MDLDRSRLRFARYDRLLRDQHQVGSGHDPFHLGSRLLVTDIDRVLLRGHNTDMDTRTIEQLRKSEAGYELFVNLIKDGCEWQGDVNSRKWGECLYAVTEHARVRVKQTLENHVEGVDYKLEGSLDKMHEVAGIWIAFV